MRSCPCQRSCLMLLKYKALLKYHTGAEWLRSAVTNIINMMKKVTYTSTRFNRDKGSLPVPKQRLLSYEIRINFHDIQAYNWILNSEGSWLTGLRMLAVVPVFILFSPVLSKRGHKDSQCSSPVAAFLEALDFCLSVVCVSHVKLLIGHICSLQNTVSSVTIALSSHFRKCICCFWLGTGWRLLLISFVSQFLSESTMLSNVLLCYLQVQLKGGHGCFYSALPFTSPALASGCCTNAVVCAFSIEVLPPSQVSPPCLVYLPSTES